MVGPNLEVSHKPDSKRIPLNLKFLKRLTLKHLLFMFSLRTPEVLHLKCRNFGAVGIERSAKPKRLPQNGGPPYKLRIYNEWPMKGLCIEKERAQREKSFPNESDVSSSQAN